MRSNKGLALSLTYALEALYFIGIMALCFWFISSRLTKQKLIIQDTDTDRYALNLANNMLSYEEVVYIKDGSIQRGILDVEKLNNFCVKGKEKPLTLLSASFLNYKKISYDEKKFLGYPNSINSIIIVDMETLKKDEKCSENFNEGYCAWGVTFSDADKDFMDCMGVSYAAGLSGIANCYNYLPLTLRISLSFFGLNNYISSEGVPVLLRYPDGTLHVGRIFAGVIRWV